MQLAPRLLIGVMLAASIDVVAAAAPQQSSNLTAPGVEAAPGSGFLPAFQERFKSFPTPRQPQMPQVKAFPRTSVTLPSRHDAPVVCGMKVVAGDPTVDRSMVSEPAPGAPRPLVRIIEPALCRGSAAVTPSLPTARR